ncbi:MAG TPA: 5'-nucleotidase C-terminal domain-containing protein [Longimicrobium sp.]|nr:5'-nucleotidase C-terminal domain-containing protein [Longimicrobium sp.]
MSHFVHSCPTLAGLLALAACAPPPPAAPEPAVRVRIVHTADVHGRLLPERPAWAGGRAVGGAAVLAAHYDSAAARFGGPTLLLSGGDDLQGTPLSNLSWGRATIHAHNAAGYDAAALGNHEFDWGVDTLAARVAESRFPWLAANLFVAGTGRHPAWARPWVMVERGGVRVGVIGIALPTTPDNVVAGRVAGLEFTPAAPAVDLAAREARAAGAHFVVVTAHVGAICDNPGRSPDEASSGCSGELLRLAREVAEPVDLFLGGHTHRRVVAEVDGVPVLEPASYDTAYSVTDLERRGGVTRVLRREVRTAWADEVDPDTAVARVVGEWEARVRPVTERVVASLAAALEHPDQGEYPLGNLLADAFRSAAGAQAALVNNGSIRRPLPAGPVTWGMLYEVQPFGNALVTVEVTGAQLRAALENGLGRGGVPDAHVSGLAVSYDPAAPAGSRVREVRLDDGRVVGDADVVTLAVTEFVARGGDRYASIAQGRARPPAMVELDALIAYLQSLPQPIAAPAGRRWRPVR